MFTYDQVLARIRQAIAQASGGQKAFAEHCGVSEQYVCDVLKGRRRLGPKMLESVGLKRVVRYVPLDRSSGA